MGSMCKRGEAGIPLALFQPSSGRLVLAMQTDFVAFSVEEMGDEAKANIRSGQEDFATSGFNAIEDSIQLVVGV